MLPPQDEAGAEAKAAACAILSIFLSVNQFRINKSEGFELNSLRLAREREGEKDEDGEGYAESFPFLLSRTPVKTCGGVTKDTNCSAAGGAAKGKRKPPLALHQSKPEECN